MKIKAILFFITIFSIQIINGSCKDIEYSIENIIINAKLDLSDPDSNRSEILYKCYEKIKKIIIENHNLESILSVINEACFIAVGEKIALSHVKNEASFTHKMELNALNILKKIQGNKSPKKPFLYRVLFKIYKKEPIDDEFFIDYYENIKMEKPDSTRRT